MRFSAVRRAVLEASTRNNTRVLQMNDFPRRNALSLEMLRAFDSALSEDFSKIRSILIKSDGGKVFSAGHDLKELKTEAGKETHAEIFRLCKEVMEKIREIDVPVIAQVSGVAAAAGCQLVAACDIVLADESAKFTVPGANTIGLYCHSPAVQVTRAMPDKMSFYMLSTGRMINAEEALQAGLVSRLCSKIELETVVEETIQAIENTSRAVQAAGKKSYYMQLEKPIGQAAEAMESAMLENLEYVDTQHGIEAFLQRKKPNWSHTDKKVE